MKWSMARVKIMPVRPAVQMPNHTDHFQPLCSTDCNPCPAEPKSTTRDAKTSIGFKEEELLPSTCDNPRSSRGSNTKTIPTKPRKTKRITAHDKYSFRNMAPNKAAKNDDDASREATVAMGKWDSP
jgi:hypothetical protein